MGKESESAECMDGRKKHGTMYGKDVTENCKIKEAGKKINFQIFSNSGMFWNILKYFFILRNVREDSLMFKKYSGKFQTFFKGFLNIETFKIILVHLRIL